MELIQKTTNHLALGCFDPGPSSHSVLMKVKEQAELLFGQTFAKQRIMMDNFQRLICSSRVFLQRVLEEGELLEDATSYQFTAVIEQEFPRVFFNFAGVNDSQESFIKLSEEAGSIFHGSPTSLRNVEPLLGEHIGTLNPPEIAMSPNAKTQQQTVLSPSAQMLAQAPKHQSVPMASRRSNWYLGVLWIPPLRSIQKESSICKVTSRTPCGCSKSCWTPWHSGNPVWRAMSGTPSSHRPSGGNTSCHLKYIQFSLP